MGATHVQEVVLTDRKWVPANMSRFKHRGWPKAEPDLTHLRTLGTDSVMFILSTDRVSSIIPSRN